MGDTLWVRKHPSRLAGYEDLHDAARLSTDPTFRLIGSPKRWDPSAALTSTLHWFETELLTREGRSVRKNVGGVVPRVTIRAAGRVFRCEIHTGRNPDPSALWLV
jgi:hypothetical protein